MVFFSILTGLPGVSARFLSATRVRLQVCPSSTRGGATERRYRHHLYGLCEDRRNVWTRQLPLLSPTTTPTRFTQRSGQSPGHFAPLQRRSKWSEYRIPRRYGRCTGANQPAKWPESFLPGAFGPRRCCCQLGRTVGRPDVRYSPRPHPTPVTFALRLCVLWFRSRVKDLCAFINPPTLSDPNIFVI